jgi:predicted ATPase
VWWVELAPIDRGDRVADAIDSAIGLTEAIGVSAVSQLMSALDGKRVLVVMDNCEHLIGSCAQVVDRLLRACSAVTVLTTTREPLGLLAETVWRVPSLFVPPDAVPLRVVAEADAVQLFVDRAQHARVGFELTDSNAAAVAEICRRLDGIPLALELAAARIRVVSVERVATELNNRFRVLTGGDRAVLPRHQTLLASVEWSHELLSDDERILLRRLSVFVGDFTVEAAESVTGDTDLDAYRVLDLLGRLIDKASYSSTTPPAATATRDDPPVRARALRRRPRTRTPP